MSKFRVEDYKLVIVEWNDAQDHETGWTSLKKAKTHSICKVRSIGWKIIDNETRIVIVGDFILEDGETSRITAIPKDWCTKITEIGNGTEQHS